MRMALEMRPVPRLPGFELRELLGEGAISVVYRGVRGNENFALKFLKRASALNEAEAGLRFRREAAAIARLNHPGLLKVIEVGEQEGLPYLVTELIEGRTLEEIARAGPLREEALLRLTISVAGALGEVHRRGLVHRDIKPANIIVQPSGTAKIVDFGFATEAEGKRHTDGKGEVIGTLQYSAPEQTGMLRRTVDGRADLYALGCVLFECATGAPPFTAKDAAELLRMHVAVVPPLAHEVNPEVRPALGAIISKLLAKDPDDRYQTAEGLLADLDNISAIDGALRSGHPVKLGARDARKRVAEVTLVGRNAEYGGLKELWAKAKGGQGSFAHVEGEGGSGKSRLLRELAEVATSEGALVLAGKAQEGERTPFGPLREAVDELLARRKRLSEEDSARLLEGVVQAAGEFAPLLKRFTKSMQGVLEGAGEMPPLEPAAEQARFFATVAEFMGALAQKLGPTLLIIDDAQWLDEGSLEVLRRLSKRVGTVPLMVASTARNDAKSEGGVVNFKKAVGNALAASIQLKPLAISAVDELVTLYLGGRRLEPAIVEKIAVRANGNPFAIGEYVRSLSESGVLRPTVNGWVLESGRLEDLNLPTDVIQLLLARLNKLSESTLQVLSAAALVGYEFDRKLLGVASHSAEATVDRALEDGFRAGLLEAALEGTYHFIHDRVREALTNLVSPERARIVHQAIAESLDAIDNDTPEHLFAVASHYALGELERNPGRVYKTTLGAGIKALETFSNQSAFELLQRAYTFAAAAQIAGSDLAVLHEQLSVASVLTGRLANAHEHIQRALEYAKEPLALARLHFLRGRAYQTGGQNAQAWDEFQLALAKLGKPLPKNRIAQVASAIWHGLAALIAARPGRKLNVAGIDKQRHQMLSKIHSAARLLTNFMNRRLEFALLTAREFHNAQFLGVSREMAKARVLVGYLMGLLFVWPKGVHRHGQIAISLAQQLGDNETLGFCELTYALAVEFSGDPVRAQEMAKKCLPRVLRYCSSIDGAPLLGHVSGSLLLQGKSSDSADWVTEHLSTMQALGAIPFQLGFFGFLYSQLALLGRIAEAQKAREEMLKLASLVPNVLHVIAQVHVHSIMVLLDLEDFGKELEEHIAKFIDAGIEDYHRQSGYLLIAYVRLEQMLRSSGTARKEALERFRMAMPRVRKWAILRRPVFCCHVRVLEAALAAEQGKLGKARRFLAVALKLADQVDSHWGRWSAWRERARLAKRSGNEQQLKQSAEEALRIAKLQGWRARIQQIRREFPLAAEPSNSKRTGGAEANASSGAGATGFGSRGESFEKKRYVDAILRVSLASASTLDPNKQARATLDELVRLLGAERAALFTVSDDDDQKLTLQAARRQDGVEFKKLTGYSTTVVNRVKETHKPVIVTGTEEGEAIGSASAAAYNLRSILAVPLMLHETFFGVVYLDSSVVKGLFGEDDLEILLAICNHIAIAMQTSRTARIEAEKRALERDIMLTAAVQSFFLPQKNRFETARCSGAGFYRPASTCSGDWWWYREGTSSLELLVGDVTGHGASAAMLTASLAGLYRALSASDHKKASGEFLPDLHRQLYELAEGKYTMTLSAIMVDEENGAIRWWNAGGPPIFIMNPDGAVEVISKSGIPLGSAHGFQLGEENRPLAPGARIFAFTDGMYEIDCKNGRQVGLKGLRALFAKTRGLSLEDAVARITGEIEELRVPGPLPDDMTFTMLDFRGGS